MTFNITSLTIYTRTIIRFQTCKLSHNNDIHPESPPKKQKKTNGGKVNAIKSRKNPPTHRRKNCLATKAH
jgi:hypothetical protein